jgi:hypothetical protein
MRPTQTHRPGAKPARRVQSVYVWTLQPVCELHDPVHGQVLPLEGLELVRRCRGRRSRILHVQHRAPHRTREKDPQVRNGRGREDVWVGVCRFHREFECLALPVVGIHLFFFFETPPFLAPPPFFGGPSAASAARSSIILATSSS